MNIDMSSKNYRLVSVVKGVLLLTAFFVLPLSMAMAQPRPQSHLDPAVVVRMWLSQDCSLGDERSLRNELILVGPALEPMFIKAFRKGPEADEMARLKEASATRYQSIRELLDSGNTMGLARKELTKLEGISLDEFTRQEQIDFKNRYRSRALSALAVIGGAKGKRILQEVSRDTRSPLQMNARELLLRERGKKKSGK